MIPHHDLAAAPVDVWRRIFETNVFGTWAMTVANTPPLRSSKAALNHLTVLLAKVVGPEVRVNAVAPGLVDVPLTADWDVIRQAVQQMAP